MRGIFILFFTGILAANAGLLPATPTVTLPPVSVVATLNSGPVVASANLTFANGELDYDLGEWIYLSELPGPISLPVNQSMQAVGVFGQNSWAVMNGSLSIPGCYSMWQVNGALGLVGSDAGGSIISCLFGNQLLSVLLDQEFFLG